MRVHSCATLIRRAALVALGLLSLVAGGPRTAAAQTPYFPYFLKNNVRYDDFDWHIYSTDHFEVFYYPELEQHLERIVGYLESAYQHISSELRHDLPDKTQVIFFKTHSEFEQQNVAPGQSLEGVGAFVESARDRMLLPIDDAPDRLYGTHRSRADARLREQHHSAGPDEPRRAPVGDGGALGLHARRMGAD